MNDLTHLANAVDNYNTADDAWNCCPPAKNERYKAIKESQQQKFETLLKRLGGGHE